MFFWVFLGATSFLMNIGLPKSIEELFGKRKNRAKGKGFLFTESLAKRSSFVIEIGVPKSIEELFGKRKNRAKGKGFTLAGSLARRSSFDDVALLSSRRDNEKKYKHPIGRFVFCSEVKKSGRVADTSYRAEPRRGVVECIPPRNSTDFVRGISPFSFFSAVEMTQKP